MGKKEEYYGVSQNEIVTKFAINRNLKRLIDNDLMLKQKMNDAIRTTSFPIKEYSSIYHYNNGDIVFFKTGKNEINIYLLECIAEYSEDEFEIPTPSPSIITVNGRQVVKPDENWAICGRQLPNQNDNYDWKQDGFEGVIDNKSFNLVDIAQSYVDVAKKSFENNHQSALSSHPFGKFSKSQSNVLFSSLENISDDRKNFLYPYHLQTLDNDNTIQYGYMRKWPNGVIEYDINFKLGVNGYTNYGYERIKANDLSIADRYSNALYFKNKRTQENVFNKKGTINSIVNNTLQENLISGVNAYSAQIYFPEDFKDTNYMIFSSNIKNVDSGVSSYVYNPLKGYIDSRLICDGRTLVGYVSPDITSYSTKPVVIPNDVLNIDDRAFEGFVQNDKKKITSLSIDATHSQLICIGDEAFRNSTIESIIIPVNVKHIGSRAFYNCTNLKDITIYLSGEVSDQVRIGKDAFKGIAEDDSEIQLNIISVMQQASFSSRMTFSSDYPITNFMNNDEDLSAQYAALSNNTIPLYDLLTGQLSTEMRNLWGLPLQKNKLVVNLTTLTVDIGMDPIQNDTEFLTAQPIATQVQSQMDVALQSAMSEIPDYLLVDEDESKEEQYVQPDNIFTIDLDVFKKAITNAITDEETIAKTKSLISKSKAKFGYAIDENYNAIITSIVSCNTTKLQFPDYVYEELDNGIMKYDVVAISSSNQTISNKVKKISCSKKYDIIDIDWLSSIQKLEEASFICKNAQQSIFSNLSVGNVRLDLVADNVSKNAFNNITADSLEINISCSSAIEDAFNNISCKDGLSINIHGKDGYVVINSFAEDDVTRQSLASFSCSKVSSIAPYAFDSCSNLNSINVDMDNCFIGKYAFNNCTSLNKVIVENAELARSEEEYWADFDDNGNLLSVDQFMQKGFSQYAFDNTNVYKVNVLSSQFATATMFSSTIANMNDGNINVELNTFAAGTQTVYRLQNDVSVVVDDGVLISCTHTSGFVNLIPLSNNLTTIGNSTNAFQGKSISAVYIGKYVKNIDVSAFANCQNLEFLYFQRDIELNSIGEDAIKNSNLYEFIVNESNKYDIDMLILDYSGQSDTSHDPVYGYGVNDGYSLSSGSTGYKFSMPYACINTNNTVHLINTITSHAINGNDKLYDIDLYNAMYVKRNAFYRCADTIMLTLNKSITEIYPDSFRHGSDNYNDSSNASVSYITFYGTSADWNSNSCLTSSEFIQDELDGDNNYSMGLNFGELSVNDDGAYVCNNGNTTVVLDE